MLKEATYVKLVLLVQLLGCEPGQQLIPQGLERGVQQGVCVATGRPAWCRQPRLGSWCSPTPLCRRLQFAFICTDIPAVLNSKSPEFTFLVQALPRSHHFLVKTRLFTFTCSAHHRCAQRGGWSRAIGWSDQCTEKRAICLSWGACPKQGG